MSRVKVTFLGTGDAFGHGGRLQASILIESGQCRFLLDCGATTLIALNRAEISPNEIDFMVLSHLHGDHCGGVPFFVLDGQLFSKREDTLTLAGPEGLHDRLPLLMDSAFPGSAQVKRKFPVVVVDLKPGQAWRHLGATVIAYEASHPPGDMRLSFRIEMSGRVIAYSGDSAWTDQLPVAARGADLFIAEAYFYEKQVPDHLDYKTLVAKRDALTAKRILLTHMGPDMFQHLDRVEMEAAWDGLVVDL